LACRHGLGRATPPNYEEAEEKVKKNRLSDSRWDKLVNEPATGIGTKVSPEPPALAFLSALLSCSAGTLDRGQLGGPHRFSHNVLNGMGRALPSFVLIEGDKHIMKLRSEALRKHGETLEEELDGK